MPIVYFILIFSYTNTMVYIVRFLLISFTFCSIFNSLKAAQIYDQTLGSYTEDFSDVSGISLKSNTNINSGVLQLTNATNTSFNAPYANSGYALSSVIKPISVAKWGNVIINANIPINTTIKMQVWVNPDGAELAFPDSALPGNSAGFNIVNGSQVIDISQLSSVANGIAGQLYGYENKSSAIKIRFIVETSDTSHTPSIDSFLVTWTPKQGDLSSTTPLVSEWSRKLANEKNTLHIYGYNPYIYPAFQWSTSERQNCQYPTHLLIYNQNLIGATGICDEGLDKIYSINMESGIFNWQMPFTSMGIGFTIGTNGTLYQTEDGNDVLKVVDLSNQTVKWTYNFSGGHSNGDIAIGEDGMLYTIRGPVLTLYAFNPDGTIAYTRSIGVGTDSTGFLADKSGVLYFGTKDNSDSGKLYAFDTKTKTFLWDYNTGSLFSAPIMGPDGTVYVGGCSLHNQSGKKLYAFNQDGTLKWESNPNLDNDLGYCSSFSLRADGIIVAARYNIFDYNFSFTSATSSVQYINSQTGSLVSSRQLTGPEIAFTDKNDGLYISSSDRGPGNSDWHTVLSYEDKNYNNKWQIRHPFNDGGIRDPEYLSFGIEYPLKGETFSVYNYSGGLKNSSLIGDSRGWVYGTLAKQAEDLPYTNSDTSITHFALAPWYLSISTNSDTVSPGSTISFSAVTSMKQVNPLFGGNNAVQVVLDTGEKIPLIYSGSDGMRSTIWTGSYVVPSGYPLGVHTYKVEASQTYLTTDTQTHFDDPVLESSNTGIFITASYKVQENAVLFSSDSNIGVKSGLTYTTSTLSTLNTLSTTPTTATNSSLNINYKTLKFGDSGGLVIKIQKALQKEGFLSKSTPLTGYFGTATFLAIKKFQKKYNIYPVSGVVANKTWSKILELLSGRL